MPIQNLTFLCVVLSFSWRGGVSEKVTLLETSPFYFCAEGAAHFLFLLASVLANPIRVDLYLHCFVIFWGAGVYLRSHEM